ncbi:MAG: GNAT family N-acetyltransferase [Treponema sp.]|nr:GNAT family N-acetyltransferase [Candidatus Treponema equifaecale]
MKFELTEKLVEGVAFAMENQGCVSAYDASLDQVISVGSEFEIDQEKVFALPLWTSEDGFNLLEEFVSTVRMPDVQKELRRVLSNGRGVFKNFKNVLKLYPQVERRFHSFKEKKMRSVIFDWYNALRESWGLEALSQDFEDYDELTRQDFTFREYDSKEDLNCIVREAGVVADEIKEFFPEEAGKAIAQIWLGRFNNLSEKTLGFVSHTLADDFAGCLLFSLCSSSEKTAALTALFVNQNYRGLGIARELFSDCISNLKQRGIQYLIIADSVVPDYLEPLLTRCGFEKNGSVYLAQI